MYTGQLTTYLVGLDAHAQSVLASLQPPAPLEQHFVVEPDISIQAAGSADVVLVASDLFADQESLMAFLDGMNGEGTSHGGFSFLDPKVVLVGMPAAFDIPDSAFESIHDIWPADMSDAQLKWRFGNLLQHIKEEADSSETTQFLETTINSIPCLVWYKTKDGVHEKVNDSFCETVGKTKDDVQGQRHAYIWNVEEDDPACIESEAYVMRTEQTCIAEESVQTDGENRLLTTYKSPLYDLDGSVMGTVGVAIDITQERAYEQDLLHKTRTLETMFTALDCGVVTHSLDGSRVIGINQAALNILGYDSEENMLKDGFDMVAQSVHEDDKEKLRETFKTLKHIGDSVSTEYRVVHDDGTILHVMGNTKLIEKDGELLYQRFLLDYSDQKLEEELREKRQQALVHALTQNYLVVCAFDLDTGVGELLRISDEADDELREIFEKNLNYENARDEYIDKRVIPEDKENMTSALDRAAVMDILEREGRMTVMYRSFVGNTVGYRQANLVRSGSWDDSGLTGHYMVLGLHDVDEETRKEMKHKELLEAALLRANKANEAKSAFLSNMSHDIRTPMNAIVGFTTLAKNHMDEVDQVEEYLDKIQASSSHLLGLINDILDMSRIESGKTSLDEKPCNLCEVVQNMVAMMQPQAEAKGITFNADMADVHDRSVICDELKLNQILLNLLGNAVKFTEEGGRVELKLAEGPVSTAGRATFDISVIDNGIGMDDSFIEHIFDPFERERTSTLSGIQGTGLGMAITKSLVDMMGGTIKVKSQKGVGTEFVVSLPFAINGQQAEEEPQKAQPTEAYLPEKFKGCKILLVDDNSLNREIATTLLEDAGFRVDQAFDGQNAIDVLENASADEYQLVLMDIQMPVMNGYEAATTIRKMDDVAKRTIPILAVTADAFEEDKQKALSCGMDGHIAKPIQIDALFSALDALLS